VKYTLEGMSKLTAKKGERLFDKNCAIAVYSHKGGVGKTTTALHLVRTMLSVNESENIIVVDMDPQMNLTHQLCTIGLRFDGKPIEFDDVVEKLSRLDYSSSEFMKITSPDVVTAIAKAEKDPRLPIEIRPASCCLTNLHTVDCFIGNMDHSHILYELTRERTNNTPSHMFDAVRNVIGKLRESYSIVIMDLPPDMFELNKTLLRCSDYIVTVLNTDIFALTTTRMIHRKLMNDRNASYYSELNEPNLLGFMMNKVKYMRGMPVTQNQGHLDKVLRFWNDVMNVPSPGLGCIPDFETQLKKETEDRKCLVNDVPSQSEKSRSVVSAYNSLLQNIINKIRSDLINRDESTTAEEGKQESSSVFD